MFKCKPGCSECCVCYHMPTKFVTRFINRATVPVVDTDVVADTIKPITSDGKCFLLNRETGKCTVYKDRPYICHMYGKHPHMLCAYVDSSGRARSLQDTNNIKAHQLVTQTKVANELVKRPFWTK